MHARTTTSQHSTTLAHTGATRDSERAQPIARPRGVLKGSPVPVSALKHAEPPAWLPCNPFSLQPGMLKRRSQISATPYPPYLCQGDGGRALAATQASSNAFSAKQLVNRLASERQALCNCPVTLPPHTCVPYHAQKVSPGHHTQRVCGRTPASSEAEHNTSCNEPQALGPSPCCCAG